MPSASSFARRKLRPDALLSVAVAAVVALVALLTAATAREVIDSAGRKVEVPDRIERIMAAGPPASVLVYMLASVRCERIADSGHRARADRLNRNIGVGSAIVYVLVMTYVFWNALLAVPT